MSFAGLRTYVLVEVHREYETATTIVKKTYSLTDTVLTVHPAHIEDKSKNRGKKAEQVGDSPITHSGIVRAARMAATVDAVCRVHFQSKRRDAGDPRADARLFQTVYGLSLSTNTLSKAWTVRHACAIRTRSMGLQ